MYGLLIAGPLWLWTCARAPLSALPRGLWLRLLVCALVGRVALLTVPPVLSEDLWRYLWDGAVLLGGGGPFDRAPSDPALDAFALSHPALEGIRGRIGHAHLPTIYPPVAQGLFAVFGLGGPSALLWRLGVVAADLSVAVGLARWAHARGDSRGLAVGWLACPLVAVESAVGAHVDVFGVAGLVWAGNPDHGNDRFRSLDLPSLLFLTEDPRARIVSLQKGPAAAARTRLGAERLLLDASERLYSFADTAALVARLDLVITVDTAVAHLAGAMGKPVWVLLPAAPDWRWGLTGDHTPWYPSMRLFRQTVLGDWAGPLAALRAAWSAWLTRAV